MSFWGAIKRAFTPQQELIPNPYIGAEAVSPTQAAVMEAARITDQEDEMADYDLEKVNAERRRRGLPPLSHSDARRAASSADDGCDMMHFLIGYTTGIPMPSVAGVMGAMLHPSPAHSESSPSYSAPEPSYSGGGGDFSGGGSSSSYDSGGSYSSGGDSGGGGGGGGGGGD